MPDQAKQKLFNHEAPVAHKIRYIVAGLQLLSGITAFIGLRLYFSSYFEALPGAARFLILAAVGLLLVGPAEIGIRLTWSYIVRSILQKQYKGINAASLAVVALAAVALTCYSFILSQYATKRSVKAAAPDIETANVAPIDSTYLEALELIDQRHAEERAEIRDRHRERIEAERGRYTALIRTKEIEILNYQQREQSTGRKYTTRINRARSDIAQLTADQAAAVALIREQENTSLANLEARKAAQADNAIQDKQTDRNAAQLAANEATNENRELAAVFSSVVAGFAAWSVVLVVLFTAFLEMFYHKTGMERQTVLSNGDFQPAALLEIANFPAVYVRRHALNFFRTLYGRLPDLKLPPAPDKLDDYTGIQQERRKVAEGTDQAEKPDTIKNGDPAHRSSGKTGPDFIAWNLAEQLNETGPKARREIGFVTASKRGEGYTSDSIKKAPPTNIVYTTEAPDNLRTCHHCGEKYQYRHHKQKYCKDACRIEAWELRKGRKLKKKPRKT